MTVVEYEVFDIITCIFCHNLERGFDETQICKIKTF